MSIPECSADNVLRELAAKQVLNLQYSWDVPLIANSLLTKGVYSDSLRELAEQTHPIMPELRPLIESALTELSVVRPNRADAAWFLARTCIQRIAAGQEGRRDSFELLKNICDEAIDVLPHHNYVGSGLDLGDLIGIYYSYSEPAENYLEAENRTITDETERRRILDELAKRQCDRWLRRHPEP